MWNIYITLDLEDHGFKYWINGKIYEAGLYEFRYNHVVKFKLNHDVLSITYRLYQPTEHVETVKYSSYMLSSLHVVAIN
mgnify:CR=1 FL=1